MVRTGLLIAAGMILPAVWGWLVEAALRRLCAPNSGSSPPRSRSGSDGAVDFQI